ncbi:MAG: DUF262 domain-containing HNH endonuclease family protein [Hyphomonadaceae bacterium]|nr:DUF262 domain-containing HNH endonuclease family protein [Hyphomonadaceae bacterium]
MSMHHLQPISDTLEFVLGNSWMEPADIQRDYQWTAEQVSELLDDLITFAVPPDGEAEEDAYFVGVIIVHGMNQQFRLYDGLQRITTLTILICLLRDMIQDAELKTRLQACVFDRKGEPRLKLIGHQYLATHIQPRGKSLSLASGRLTGQAEVLRAAQKHMRDQLRTLSPRTLYFLAWTVLERVLILRLSVATPAMANRIFRTINMRGLKLEDADLIKSRLAEFPGSAEEVEELLTAWQDIRQALTARSQARVDQVEESHRYDRYSGFQGFVLALEMMERFTPDTPDHKPSTVERLNGFVDLMKSRHGTAKGLTGYFRFLHKCATDWNTLHQPAMGGQSSPFNPLLPIRAVWWTEWKPLALRVMGRASQMESAGPPWRARIFDQMHRAAIAMELAGFSPMKRQLVFAKAIEELKDGATPDRLESLVMWQADLIRIHSALTGAFDQYQLRRSTVVWIEYIMSGAPYSFLRDMTVEHVLPVSTHLPAGWLKEFPDWQTRRDVMNLLGNLILLPRSINQGFGDDTFEEKMAALTQRESELEGLNLVYWVRKCEDWTPDRIRTLTDHLAAYVWDALKMSDVDYATFGAQRA